jgi:hypothetical protein
MEHKIASGLQFQGSRRQGSLSMDQPVYNGHQFTGVVGKNPVDPAIDLPDQAVF